MSYVNGVPVGKPRKKTRPPRPRAESAQETREALISAGAKLFGERGLDAPSLDDICARAGRTRGAFYVHFADRDAFLEAVMERVGREYLDRLLVPDGDLATVAERFLESMTSGSYPLTRSGGVRPHQLIEACVRSKRIRARYLALLSETLARVGSIVAASQLHGRVRFDVNPRAVAAVLLATVVGAQTMMELGAPFDPAAAATTLVTAFAPPRAPAR